jgi:hypothetical protein
MISKVLLVPSLFENDFRAVIPEPFLVLASLILSQRKGVDVNRPSAARFA